MHFHLVNFYVSAEVRPALSPFEFLEPGANHLHYNTYENQCIHVFYNVFIQTIHNDSCICSGVGKSSRDMFKGGRGAP